jgi:hypothetical protein
MLISNRQCCRALVIASLHSSGVTSITKGERLRNARLTDRSVAKIVKAYAVRVGLDPRPLRVIRCDLAS